MRMGQNGVVFLKPEDDGGELPTEDPNIISGSIDGPNNPDTTGGGVPEETNLPDGEQQPTIDGTEEQELPEYPSSVQPGAVSPQQPLQPILPQYPVQPAEPDIDEEPPQTDFDVYDEVNEIKAN